MYQRHPWLANFTLDEKRLGPSAPLARTALGKQVTQILLSTEAVAAVVGAIDAAPARPPQPALDRYLVPAIGLAALADQVKILVGRILRQVVEHIGGRHVKKGRPVIVASIFANGSIYSLPGAVRGKMNAAERRAWADRQFLRTSSEGAASLS